MLEGPYLPLDAINDLERYVEARLNPRDHDDPTFLELVRKLIATAKRNVTNEDAAVQKTVLESEIEKLKGFMGQLRRDLDALAQDVMEKATTKKPRKRRK